MPFLLLATSLFVLSQSAIFIRYAHADAAAIGLWRLVIAVAFLAGWITLKKTWNAYSTLSRKQWLQLGACAFFLFAHFYTWFLSVQKTSVANSMIIFSSNPIYTAIGAWIFFHERVQRRHVVSLLFCLAGLYFLVRESLSLEAKNLQGDLLGLACSIFFSAYILMSKRLRQGMDNVPFAFATYSFCGLFFASVMVVDSVPLFGYDTQTWLAFAALAFGSTLLGHSLFTHCLQYFNVNLMSVSTLSEPIISAYMAYLLLGEPVTDGAVIGFLLVSVGIVVLYFPYLRALATGQSHARS